MPISWNRVAGITEHNIELGVLVRGPTVMVVEHIIDLYRQD